MSMAGRKRGILAESCAFGMGARQIFGFYVNPFNSFPQFRGI